MPSVFGTYRHYTLMLLNLIVEQHWHAWLAHPLDIQKSMGIKRVKNDKVDALRSRNTHAHFERKHVCSQHRTSSSINSSTCSHVGNTWFASEPCTRSISDLNRCMDKDIKKAFDQLDKRLIVASDRAVIRVEQLIGTIKADDITSEQYNLLLTIPGVGPQLASYLIALTDGFHRFTNPRELACHAGVAPFERSSGSSIRGRTQVSHQANKILKTMLHMAALANVQREGELKVYFQRKVSEGKKPILVVNAVRNKIIHCVCAVIRNNRPYEQRQLVQNWSDCRTSYVVSKRKQALLKSNLTGIGMMATANNMDQGWASSLVHGWSPNA
ncbi:MAG: IS110 family transposase [Flavobacteriales bacterium]|nr:IS110 family transposase [Flavobacteriales bacterium]